MKKFELAVDERGLRFPCTACKHKDEPFIECWQCPAFRLSKGPENRPLITRIEDLVNGGKA